MNNKLTLHGEGDAPYLESIINGVTVKTPCKYVVVEWVEGHSVFTLVASNVTDESYELFRQVQCGCDTGPIQLNTGENDQHVGEYNALYVKCDMLLPATVTDASFIMRFKMVRSQVGRAPKDNG